MMTLFVLCREKYARHLVREGRLTESAVLRFLLSDSLDVIKFRKVVVLVIQKLAHEIHLLKSSRVPSVLTRVVRVILFLLIVVAFLSLLFHG